MKTLVHISLILLLLALSTRCKKDIIDKQPTIVKQKFIFQKEYINYAWGYQLNGWIIDTSGTIYSYNLPDQWNNFDSLSNISNSLLKENISYTKETIGEIDHAGLSEMLPLIEEASKGTLTDPVNEMADAGTISFYCFVYDTQQETYKRILLNQTGDFSIKNNSVEANELYLWLKEIDEQIQSNNLANWNSPNPNP